MSPAEQTPVPGQSSAPLLQVQNLRTGFSTDQGLVVAVEDVSFDLDRGGVLGIVGESGCGKSVTSLSIMRLLGARGRVLGGSITFDGTELTTASDAYVRGLRGGEIAMIFQEPMTSLNPLFTIGDQLTEAVRTHRAMDAAAARRVVVEMLEKVGLPRAEKLLNEYPHRLSGGMCQRAMIAMALVCRPQLLIADEPTTALDVTVQAQILELLREVRDASDTAILLITHDLGVVAEMADDVMVMYAGQVVESASVFDLFARPLHPYTRGLLGSLPRVDAEVHRLASIPGSVPSIYQAFEGCRFAARCPLAEERCRTQGAGPLADAARSASEKTHHVRCWKAEGVSQ